MNALTHHGISALLRRDMGSEVPGQVDINTPSINTQNPLAQAMIQRYAGLSPEKLQELAVQLGGTPQGQVVESLLRQKRFTPNAGGSQQQPTGYAAGGSPTGIPLSMASPWWERAEARGADSVFLNGSTLGRADSLRTQAPSGSYVLPADVVAGLGEGNGEAGARIMQEILATGPHGVPLPRMRARGGATVQEERAAPVDVMLSHGETIILPHAVKRLGRGDLKRGHRLLDAFILEVRRRNIAHLKKLPGPVKT